MTACALAISPPWHRTGSSYFPVAAQVDGHWWVLRINGFPEHLPWTLFIDGRARQDVAELPQAWGNLLTPLQPVLSLEEARAALAPVGDLIAYGSETGTPCRNPFCCG